MRTVKVEITKEDGSVLRLVGDEAEKWQRAVEGQATLCSVHGVNFPELAWKEDPPGGVENARALELADDIVELQRQIDGLENPGENIGDRNALHSLMSQQALAASVVARWVQARLRGA